MKNTLLLILLLLGQLCCTPTREAKRETFTADFFYGAWADSLNDQNGGKGIILGTESDFYFIWDGNISGGNNFEPNLKLTYNLILDKEPIEVEILSKYISSDSIKKKGRATIDVIDKRHIIWRLLSDDGNVVDSMRLTRAPNQ